MENFLHDFLYNWGYLGLFLIIFFDNMNIPFPPTEVVLSLAGWFIAKGIFNFTLVFIISTVAGILGCVAFYVLIRYAEGFVMPKMKKYLRISDAKIEKSIAFFHKHGGKGVLLGRLIPGMRTISIIPAALLKYPFKKFLLWVSIGTALWNGGLLIIGYYFGQIHF